MDRDAPFMDSRISILFLMEIRRPSISMILVANTMKPSPPTWISTSRTACPNREKVVPVSTATRPVTHTAEVAVNRLSSRPMLRPSRVETGSASSSVPSRMMPRKPNTSHSSGRGSRLGPSGLCGIFTVCPPA